MKVTLKTILTGEEYAPVPGTEYEVAEGVTVKMKRPYLDLQEEFEEVEEEADAEFAGLRNDARALQKKRKEAGEDDPVSEEELTELKTLLRQLKRKQRQADVRLAKLVTSGEWPERIQPRVASKIVADFRSASTPTESGLVS